jgi:hypothetical protein
MVLTEGQLTKQSWARIARLFLRKSRALRKPGGIEWRGRMKGGQTGSDRTARAVAAQFRGMGCETYEVGVRDSASCPSAS